jgi:hypothetical protein
MTKAPNQQQQSIEDILLTSIPTIMGREFKNNKKDRFIKGPIPFSWISRAACLSSSALKIGLILWYLAGLNKSETVKLSNRYLTEFGIHRAGKYRGLQALQLAGLISVSNQIGRSPLVTILKGKLKYD